MPSRLLPFSAWLLLCGSLLTLFPLPIVFPVFIFLTGLALYLYASVSS
jgi:hypothetical protein